MTGGARDVAVLRTQRLVLRPFTASDLPHLVELDTDPDVVRHTGRFADPPTEEAYRPVLPARLRRAAWGRGLATEGGRAIVGRSEGRLVADALVGNHASARVLEKLGFRFTHEGTDDEGRATRFFERP